MIPAGGGAIVATASTNAFWVESGMAHYNASKGGIVALVKSAALDLGPFGVRQRRRSRDDSHPRQLHHRRSGRWSGYLKECRSVAFAEPSEMAAVVAFLASDDASYASGELLVATAARPSASACPCRTIPSRARCALKSPNPPREVPIMKSAVIEQMRTTVSRGRSE